MIRSQNETSSPAWKRARTPTILVLVPTATAAATTAAVTAAATAATTATAAALGLRPGFVDGEGATLDLFAVQARDCCLGFLVGAHLDKAESLGSARVAVHDDLGRLYGAKGLEQLLQIAFTAPVRQIPPLHPPPHHVPP